jgi:hypothetical protein
MGGAQEGTGNATAPRVAGQACAAERTTPPIWYRVARKQSGLFWMFDAARRRVGSSPLAGASEGSTNSGTRPGMLGEPECGGRSGNQPEYEDRKTKPRDNEPCRPPDLVVASEGKPENADGSAGMSDEAEHVHGERILAHSGPTTDSWVDCVWRP